VVFLTASTGKLPSPWALAYVAALLLARPLLIRLLARSGHGELLVLFGLGLALVAGAAGFGVVGLKPDLGALVAGLLISSHPKAKELAKTLLTLKDVFLVGFFLQIGLSAPPTVEALTISGLLVVAAPIKAALYFLLLTRFKLRARSALLSSLSLANYSEFGLIVGAVGVANGWIGAKWLVIVAIALSFSFLVASAANTRSQGIYALLKRRLVRFETGERHPDDQLIAPRGAEMAVFGMGRVGAGCYDTIRERQGDIVVGFDYDSRVVEEHRRAGRNVILGDATDSDLWDRLCPSLQLRLVLLAMNDHASNLDAARRLAASPHSFPVAAVAQHEDQIAELEQAGVDAVYNLYAEAGFSFAEHVCTALDPNRQL
jgi:hypothetical protein